MSVQGRMNRPMAFLDWAWWNGLVGLIMTIVTWISLISFIIYMRNSTSSPYSATNDPTKLSRSFLLLLLFKKKENLFLDEHKKEKDFQIILQ